MSQVPLTKKDGLCSPDLVGECILTRIGQNDTDGLCGVCQDIFEVPRPSKIGNQNRNGFSIIGK